MRAFLKEHYWTIWALGGGILIALLIINILDAMKVDREQQAFCIVHGYPYSFSNHYGLGCHDGKTPIFNQQIEERKQDVILERGHD